MNNRPAKESLAVRNPRNGQYDYQLDITSNEAIAYAANLLRQGQAKWSAQTVLHRSAVLKQWHSRLQANRDAIINALIDDTGRFHETQLEFESVLSTLLRWCEDAKELLNEPEPISSHAFSGFTIAGQGIPYELVGIISPWNFPMLLSLIDAIPALLAGCSVIIKPSEVTPRFIAPLMKTIREIPELTQVLSYVCGDGSVGAELINHVDIVIFTGSVATGRKVGEAAAKLFIPAFLELGGKDPVIVTANANIPRAVHAIAWGGLVNAGQSCLSVERIYVAKQIHDEFVNQLRTHVSTLTLCTDTPEQGHIGPIIAERQADIICSQLDDAIKQGAKIECGGQVKTINGGLWCEPTVLSNVSHSMRIMREENFGPVLPVMAFADIDEALRLANDSEFGLSAAVFAKDTAEALSIGKKILAGAISINDCALTAVMHEGEKQSFKLSGIGGSRMGAASMRRFLRRQVHLINDQQRWNPWWFKAE